MANLTESEAKRLDQDIEDLELHDLDEQEIERVVKAHSAEGMQLRRERKNVRYKLYRLKAESIGKTSSVAEEGFREKFESQPLFTNWKDFASEWDVALDDPYRIVRRYVTPEEEWNAVVESKFPRLTSDGGVVYPDIKVKEAVDKEAERQNEMRNGENS